MHRTRVINHKSVTRQKFKSTATIFGVLCACTVIHHTYYQSVYQKNVDVDDGHTVSVLILFLSLLLSRLLIYTHKYILWNRLMTSSCALILFQALSRRCVVYSYEVNIRVSYTILLGQCVNVFWNKTEIWPQHASARYHSGPLNV